MEDTEKRLDKYLSDIGKKFNKFLGEQLKPLSIIKRCLIILIIGYSLFLLVDYIFKPQVDPLLTITGIDTTITYIKLTGFVGHPIIVTFLLWLWLIFFILITAILLTLVGILLEENTDGLSMNFKRNFTASLYSFTPFILLLWQLFVPQLYNGLIQLLAGGLIASVPLIYTYERQKKTGFIRSGITIAAVYILFINLALTINTILILVLPQSHGSIYWTCSLC